MVSNLFLEMKKHKITQAKIAETLGISTRAAFGKVNGETQFTADEMFKIQEAYFPDKSLEYLFKKEA